MMNHNWGIRFRMPRIHIPNPIKTVVNTVRSVSRAVAHATDQVKSEIHNAGKAVDGAIGTNLSGHNSGGWLNRHLGKQMDFINPLGYMRDLATGKDMFRDMAGRWSDAMHHSGLGFDGFMPRQPDQKGNAGVTNTQQSAVNNQADAASLANKNQALKSGMDMAQSEMDKSRELGARNMGSINQDEMNNSRNSLLDKLKRQGSQSQFSNDFIR